MSTRYSNDLAPILTRYSGSAELLDAIRSAAVLAYEIAPQAEFPDRYRAGHYPFTVPAEWETGEAFWIGQTSYTVVNGQRIGRDERECILCDGPACKWPMLKTHPESPGPFLPLPADRRVTFHFQSDGSRGSMTVANVRADLLRLADKVHSNRAVFDGKIKKTKCPAAVTGARGSAPHVAARALWNERDYSGAIALAQNVGSLFVGAGSKPGERGHVYMRAESVDVAGHPFVIARSIASGKFQVVHVDSGLSVSPSRLDADPRGYGDSGFVSHSAALDWVETAAQCDAWRDKLDTAIAKAAPLDQCAALAHYLGGSAEDPAQDVAQAIPAPAAPVVAPISAADASRALEIVESFYDENLRGAPGETVPVEKIEARAAHLRGSAAGYADHAPARGIRYAEAARILEEHASAKRAPAAPVSTVRHVSAEEFDTRAAELQARAASEAAALADAPPTRETTNSEPAASRPARDGDRVYMNELALGSSVAWQSISNFQCVRAHQVIQNVIGGWLSGSARWATCAETGAFIYGLGANGKEINAAPFCEPAPADPVPVNSAPLPVKPEAAPINIPQREPVAAIEPDVFIRSATNAERMGSAPRQRAMRSIVPMPGHTVMFKPYGHKGAGFYWVLDRAVPVSPTREFEPVADAFDAMPNDPQSPKPTFGRYRYAPQTGQTVVAFCPSVDGYKTRASRLAEYCKFRYVGRAGGYVGTEKKADYLRELFAAGFDASAYLQKLIPPAQADSVDPLPGKCDHPPRRLFAGYAMQADGQTGQWVACCDCGEVLRGGATLSEAEQHDEDERDPGYAAILAANRLEVIGATPGDAAARAGMMQHEADLYDRAARRTDSTITPRLAGVYLAVSATLGDAAERARRDAESADDTIHAPLDGLDVSELTGADAMAEFERASLPANPPGVADHTPQVSTIPGRGSHRIQTGPRVGSKPPLWIPPGDLRGRIPARFAPCYVLQA